MGCHPQGLPADQRVRKRAEFLRIQETGQKLQSANFLFFLEKSDGPAARLGITVSRRVGNAVVRNRLKRLVREVFRRNKPRISVTTNLVVVARRGAAGLDVHLVEQEFERLWARSGRK